jgi:hypothetical protein
MKKLLNLLPAISLAVAMLASHPAAAAANVVTVVATINGGGTALMYAGPGMGDKSVSSFGIHATLYSDGTASGHVDCVDQHDDTSAGNIFGEVTSWSLNAADGDIDDGIQLHVTGQLITFPGGHPVDTSFPVTIQAAGGAGVGKWTLGNPAAPFCIEILLSGQIVVRGNVPGFG